MDKRCCSNDMSVCKEREKERAATSTHTSRVLLSWLPSPHILHLYIHAYSISSKHTWPHTQNHIIPYQSKEKERWMKKRDRHLSRTRQTRYLCTYIERKQPAWREAVSENRKIQTESLTYRTSVTQSHSRWTWEIHRDNLYIVYTLYKHPMTPGSSLMMCPGCSERWQPGAGRVSILSWAPRTDGLSGNDPCEWTIDYECGLQMWQRTRWAAYGNPWCNAQCQYSVQHLVRQRRIQAWTHPTVPRTSKHRRRHPKADRQSIVGYCGLLPTRSQSGNSSMKMLMQPWK